MSAHILLNILNEFGKSHKKRNEINEFNNTGARMLDSFYHMTYRLL